MPNALLAQSAITSTDDIIRQFRPTAGGSSRSNRGVPAPVTASLDAASRAQSGYAGPSRNGAGRTAAMRVRQAPAAPAMAAA